MPDNREKKKVTVTVELDQKTVDKLKLTQSRFLTYKHMPFEEFLAELITVTVAARGEESEGYVV